MKRLVSTCCFMAIAALLPWRGTAQIPSHDELARKAADVAIVGAREMLRPVVEALRLRTSDNPTIQALLDKVIVAASPRLLGKGNAGASGVQRPLVGVDLSLILEATSIANLAVGEVTGFANTREVVRQVGFNYGQALRQALERGTALPAISFRPDEFLSDPVDLERIRVLSVPIGQSILAGITLHEIGHHVLDHPARAPKNFQESRTDELAADAWAFKEMQRIGISLWGLHRFMALRAIFEPLERALGVLPDEAVSTHPLWSRRQAELERQHDVSKAPTEDIRAFVTVLQSQEPGKPAQITKLYLAAPNGCGPQRGMFVGAVHFGNLQGTGLCEERDGQIWLYQRAPDGRIEFVVETPDAFVTRITRRTYDLPERGGGKLDDASFRALRMSMAFSLTDPAFAGLTVDATIRLTPVSILSPLLTKAGATPGARAAALPVMRRCLAEQGTLVISYGKGVIRTVEDLLARAAGPQKACNDELETILGKTVVTRLQAEAFDSPLVQAGLTRLIKSAAGAPSAPIARGDATRTPAVAAPTGRGRQLGADARIWLPTKDSVRELLQLFLEPGADKASLFELVRPTRADYSAVFTDPIAAELYETHRKLFETGDLITASPRQTSLIVVIGTTSDLIDRTPNASVFAGGWDVMRSYLKRDIPLVTFSFVRPGETLGIRYDGLFYVGTRWVLMPTPWQFIKR